MIHKSTNSIVAIIANRYTDFRRPAIEQMADQLNAAGFGVLCVIGRELSRSSGSTSASIRTCTGIYRTIPKLPVDGVIVLSATLTYESPSNVVDELIRQYTQVPLVSFGLDVPGIPSLVLDNKRCMQTVMEHMTQDEKRTRYVFIRGCPVMPDSIEREAVFRDALADRKIPIDEKLIITGDFLATNTYQSMGALLDETHEIDAVVAASDIMAVSAIQALKDHGLRVPEDVIVSGFDNRPIATDSTPRLTTVNYSFDQRATLATDILLRLIEGKSVDDLLEEQQSIDGELIARQSSRQPSGSVRKRQFIDENVNLLEFLKNKFMSRPAPGAVDFEKVVQDLTSALIHQSEDFENTVSSHLQRTLVSPDEARWWEQFSKQLEVFICQYDLPEQWQVSLPMILRALVGIREFTQTRHQKNSFEFSRIQRLQDDLHIELASCTTLNEIFTAIRPVLEKIKIQQFYLVLYVNPTNIPDNIATVAFSHPAGNPALRHDREFESCGILPPEIQHEIKSGLLVMTPLCTGYTNFGYILLDPSDLAALNVENLANSISIAICNCRRVRSLQNQARELTATSDELSYLENFDTLTGLSNRNRFERSFERVLKNAKVNNTPVEVLYLDLDGFKRVNDTFGQNLGDELLKQIGGRFNAIFRQTDIFARMGSDEFAIVFEQVRAEERSADVANRVLDELRKPFKIKQVDISLTASLGIAQLNADGDDVETLLKNADAAMYHSKSLGKNRFCYYADII